MHRITNWYSNKVKGTLPTGCQLCSLGSKLVLFITGKCDSNCFYCPISKEKRNDVIYANEKLIHSFSEIINEANMITALGAGITGGDPLSNIDRTVEYISKLKQNFGANFHCHLYTSYAITYEDLNSLKMVGLDEIRFHPPRLILTEEIKKSILNAKSFSWKVGFEIPVIPKNQNNIQMIIDFAEENNLDFVNLNELEITEENIKILNSSGYYAKSDYSVAVQGSQELAIEILKKNRKKNITLHYCSSSYKDNIQLRNRLIRRAKKFALPSDEITDDGLIVRAQIIIDNSNFINQIVDTLVHEFKVPEQLMYIDKNNHMILTNWLLVKKFGFALKEKFPSEILAIQIIHQYPIENGIITYLEPIIEEL